MRSAAIALLGVLTVASCSKKERAEPAAALASAEPAAPASSTADVAAAPADPRKMIRTGRVELLVAAYDEARHKLDALLAGSGGYVDSTRVGRYRGAVSGATLVVRVPAAAFGGLLPRLAELGEVTSETTDATDVTDQYVDTEARLASQQQLEKRLLELAAARTGTIDQVLAVERELARVRGEIETYQGRLKLWSDQVALSTLTIELRTQQTELADAPPRSLSSQSSGALHASLDAMRELARFLAIALIALLPWLLVAAPVYLAVRRIVRRARRSLPRAIAKPPVAAP